MVRVVEVVQDVQIVQVVQVVKVVSLDDTHTEDIWCMWFTGSQRGQGVGLQGPRGSRGRPTGSQRVKG